MLPNTHLTSHSRMSVSRWVITPSWFSGSLIHFCTVLLCTIDTSFYSLLLLLGLTVSVLYCAHSDTKYSFDISNFLEGIPSLFHSIVFLYFFTLFIYGLLISPCCFLWLASCGNYKVTVVMLKWPTNSLSTLKVKYIQRLTWKLNTFWGPKENTHMSVGVSLV